MVVATKPGLANATAWTFVVPTGRTDLSGERTVLSAQPLAIRQVTLLGANGAAARAAGALASIIGLLMGLPAMDAALRRVFAGNRSRPH